MKHLSCALKCGIALLVVLAASFAVSHENHHSKIEAPKVEATTLNEINEAYLKSVKPIFQKACFDCHSSQTSYPWYSKIPGVKKFIQSDIDEARKHLDMSNNFPFGSHATPAEDLIAIKKSLEEHSMPPSRYRLMHPSNAIAEDERKLIYKWLRNALQLLSEPQS